MVLMLIFCVSLVAASGVLLIRAVALGREQRRQTLVQIAAYGFHADAPAAEPPADLRRMYEELSKAAGEKALAHFDSLRQGERGLRELLNAAGMYRTSVAAFVGSRVLLALCGPAVVVLASLAGGLRLRVLLSGLLISLMGWYLPYIRLQRRARVRLEQIDREVPELVDLLVTTVEGGVGFAAGLQLASRSIEGPLGQELRLALREQSLGLTPEEALKNLSQRVDSPATRAFTQALVQGESLGVSIGQILRDLAGEMRSRRRQAAEERAQKTPTKILFPLVALILPAMFIVTLGPVLMETVRFLGS